MEKQREKLKNNPARRYLRKVRGLLPCSRKMKDEITAPLRRSMAEYLLEQPDASAEDFRARFGTPEVIAASCLEDVETTDLLRRLRLRRRVMAILVSAVILILLSWGCYLAYCNYEFKNQVTDRRVEDTSTPVGVIPERVFP